MIHWDWDNSMPSEDEYLLLPDSPLPEVFLWAAAKCQSQEEF